MLQDSISQGLCSLGIVPGDTVLIHSSMKSLGVTEKPQEVLNAIRSYLGEKGTLCLPALSYATVNQENPYFSYKDTPACIGLLPETFRKMEGVVRSMSPTHSVCAAGYLAKELTCDQHLDNTPVGPHSPFRKLPAIGGKILMLGCGLHSNTFMHGMEEAALVPYVFYADPWEYTMEREDGTKYHTAVMRHGMGRWGRQSYHRCAGLMQDNELTHGFVCAAECWCYDAAALEKRALSKIAEDPWYFLEPNPGVKPFIERTYDPEILNR